MTEVLATVSASAPRRLVGVSVLLLLGGLLIYLALARPHESLGWQVFLLIFGAIVLWVAETMRRATSHTLTLTEDGITASDGQLLARIEDIDTVVRGTFAMKPSHGFVLKLKSPMGRVWAPGLWWRFGRRVGVGGVTGAGQTKFMAEMLTLMLMEKKKAGS
ncbi:hypothetical protein [Actibacterium lipolyticum]|uniref:Uncharacterized protein n=1 Tax=Actibacterium lipolyticum TaxID=1524263 RepID=A0A238JRT9_9RHOB|nr:hypothetical protein [Actibacterium lipolyticum]SMX33370.1 hypothetical protein COL8621_01010 [Actibacterium lipolyticum]